MDGFIKKEDFKNELIAKGFYSEDINNILENMMPANVVEVPTKSDKDVVKEWLDSLLKCDKNIKTIEKEIAYWNKNSKVIDANIHIQELKNKMQDIMDFKLKASKLINKIPDYVGRSIFTKRYILCKKWDDIADELGEMTVRNARYIYDATLIEFVKLWKKEMENDLY